MTMRRVKRTERIVHSVHRAADCGYFRTCKTLPTIIEKGMPA